MGEGAARDGGDVTVHKNSLAAYDSLDLNERCRAVLKVYLDRPIPLTDRHVMELLGFTDPNMVRPRVTDLVDMKVLEECGEVQDSVTKKTVRLCRPCATIPPSAAVKQQRKEVCLLIAKMAEQGVTEQELARVFPSMGARLIGEAVRACWAYGYISKVAGEIRQNAPVYHIAKAGLEALKQDPATTWHVDQPSPSKATA